jgi:RNA polymerase sigma factor (TIGR02999 family)
MEPGADDISTKSAEELLPLVYEELRKLAVSRMAKESKDHTLQPTALVHEAWMRLSKGDGSEAWDSKGHFFSAAAEAMRRVLVDSARRKQTKKRGGGAGKVRLQDIDEPAEATEDTLLAVHEALEKLHLEDAKAADLVTLRFFTGLSVDEASLALDISERTARRYWRFARAWLFDELREPGSS